MTPTGNSNIPHSAYLLGLKTQKTTSAHFTLQKRLKKPAVCAFLQADVPHSTHSTCFNNCWQNNHIKEQRGPVMNTASEVFPTWNIVQHYVLPYLVALWKTVLPLTRSPKGGGRVLSSCINFDVYIWIGKQWDVREYCSDVLIAYWCLFALKRRSGKQRRGKRKERKTCKEFFPKTCACTEAAHWAKILHLQIQTNFLRKYFSIFIRIKK